MRIYMQHYPLDNALGGMQIFGAIFCLMILKYLSAIDGQYLTSLDWFVKTLTFQVK